MQQPKKSILAIYMLLSFVSFTSSADEMDEYEFNTGFIMGAKDNIDLKRFNQAPISEGTYSIDVYTDEQWRGRYDLKLTKQQDGILGICYTSEMLMNFGINADKLNSKLSKTPGFCGTLTQWNESDDIKQVFVPSTLKLSIVVPQIYLLSESRGYIDPVFWDSGIPAMTLSYNANYYDNHTSGKLQKDLQNFYLGLNGSISYKGWLLKHSGNLTWQNSGGLRSDNAQTYLQHGIAAIKSNIVLGQFYTEGSFFDSIKLRGAKLTTDDKMYPDGMSSYVPEINGVAMSNALVTVRQSGNIIYQTSVPPGPFSIKDITSLGYGSDLDVTVKEADGNENTFTVPYASISQLSRPGFTHYQIAVGKSDNSYLTNQPNILQGTIQHGVNNLLTLYSGTTQFNNYHAYLFGAGLNTGIGALGMDITSAQTELKDTRERGYRYRVSFNRQFTDTKTNIILSLSHSTRDYYSTDDALYHIDYHYKNIINDRFKRKNSMSLTLNQNLPAGYGSLYFTGQIDNTWNDKKTRTQFQQTYNNRWGDLFYSVSFTRVYSNSKADNRFSLSFNFPLGFSDKRATVTSNTLFNNSHYGSSQIGVNGTFDQRGLSTYGVNASVGAGGDQSIALNTSYQSYLANVSGNYSQGKDYRQFGVGASGSLVVHEGGVTFSPNISDTMVLIEAKGAEGATIPGSLGTKIDSNGYALAAYVRPYRINRVSIDPKGSNEDISFNNTSSQVVPYEGSITKVKFDTKIEKTRIFDVVDSEGKPLAFGQDVTNKEGDSIGVVSQGGQVFIYDDKATSAIVKELNGQCSFSLDESYTNSKVCL